MPYRHPLIVMLGLLLIVAAVPHAVAQTTTGSRLQIPASVFEGIELTQERHARPADAPATRPLQAEASRDGWFKRHWKWVVPVVAAAVVTVVVIAAGDDDRDRDRDRDRDCGGACS